MIGSVLKNEQNPRNDPLCHIDKTNSQRRDISTLVKLQSCRKNSDKKSQSNFPEITMRYLGDRPKSSYHGRLDRDKYLYESRNAGVGSSGPMRDLFQERLALSGISGTTYEPFKRQNHHK